MLRALFRCWFYDFSCHRSKEVAKLLVITAVFGELSHRLSQVETIVANHHSCWTMCRSGSVAQTFSG